MRLSRSVLPSLALMVGGARAFAPRTTPVFGVTPSSRFSSSSQLQANVLKLSDPQRELLDKVDVFIFDCDGVIWRVRIILAL